MACYMVSVPPRTYQSPQAHPGELLKHGPLVRLAVSRSPKDGFTDPLNTPQMAIGLIDTGATFTSISIRLAERLQLIPIDRSVSVGAHGEPVDCLIYIVDIKPVGSELVLRRWKVYSCDLHGGKYDVLVGRDFLSFTHFTYDGAHASFSLTVPSLNHPLCDIPPTPVTANKVRTSDTRNAGRSKAMQKTSRKRNRSK